ncbi:MAG: hypothetical protein RIK87_29985 [Fuerstiella sp.]
MIRSSVYATLALSLCMGAAADAAIIAGFSGVGTGSSLAALDPAANAFVSAAPVVTTGAVGNNDYTGPAAGSPNTVSVGLDVYAMDPGKSFSLIFATADDGTAATDGSTEYFFTVSLTNMLNANGIDPGNSMKEINGVDVAISSGGAALAGFDAPPLGGNPAPFATGGGPFPLQVSGIIPAGPNAGNLRFGGLSGGGGGISFTTTGVLNFAVDLADLTPAGASGPGFLTLTFTANPEPTTFALAGLALIPAGIAVRRRRKQKAEASAQEATAAA